ncbi:MAG: S9 family peptidase [Theionarchaea archaeon]|nr:S9 family peptidase [Theionarchaea archaeon]MBU7037657.1 S9 family peptidase [Theionarchaea archaeon]
MPAKNRFITAEDLYDINLISDCQISPDGTHVAYAMQRIDRKTEKKYTNLWIVPTGGGNPHQFTSGDHSDSTPRWSPDGSRIAFLSNRDDEKQPQIYIIPFTGGEARKLTDFKGTIGSFEWSPQGTEFICCFQKKDQEEIEREEDEQKKKLGIVSRHITRVFYKEDGKGFSPRERFHLWVVDAETGEATQITDHEVFDEEEPTWSPDGNYVVFRSNHADDPDLDPDAIDMFVIPKKGGDIRKVNTPPGPKNSPRISPDGKWIAYYGWEGKEMPWKSTHLWVVPFDGSATAQDLTGEHDFNVASWTINDLPGSPSQMPPTWSHDSTKIFFQVAHHGNTVLRAITLDNRLESMIEDIGVVGSFTLDRSQTILAYFHGDMKDPGQIWVLDLKKGTKTQVTHVSEVLFQSLTLGEVEEVWFKGAAGNDLQGWILKPPDFDPSRKYPSILEIHGGPRVQYGNFFMHEFFFLAAQGYVVYFCNPRGGQGYGEAHSKSIWNAWGTVDYDDLMAWTDYVERKPYIDQNRMGVTGGSYGGYMTNWIIGHTQRFKAAVTQRSVSNLTSMYGSSDFNWAFQDEFGNETPWENIENYWKQSPMKYIGNAKTPTQVIHSENDLRANIEQGFQVFVALKRLGVDTELVLFPDEPHGLSRGGRTDRRIARLNHIKRWFDTYLKG